MPDHNGSRARCSFSNKEGTNLQFTRTCLYLSCNYRRFLLSSTQFAFDFRILHKSRSWFHMLAVLIAERMARANVPRRFKIISLHFSGDTILILSRRSLAARTLDMQLATADDSSKGNSAPFACRASFPARTAARLWNRAL